jgi:hypothetical protein
LVVLAGQNSDENATVPSALKAVHFNSTPAEVAHWLVMIPVSVASSYFTTALVLEMRKSFAVQLRVLAGTLVELPPGWCKATMNAIPNNKKTGHYLRMEPSGG